MLLARRQSHLIVHGSGGPPRMDEKWFEKFGDKLPTALWTELDGLKIRLGA